MKSIVFDTGPIISLTMNNLLWLLEPLKDRFGGEFYISKTVREELIDKPLSTKKFKFEALQTLQYIKRGTLKVIDNENTKKITSKLLELANNSFKARGNWIRIVHHGEIESLASAILLNSKALVIDERTTRTLLEDPKTLIRILQNKLHTKIFVNEKNLVEFEKEVRNIKVIRSVELITAAFELGLLDRYLPDISNPKENLLDAVLWGAKFYGCAVSNREIEDIIRLEVH
jgi:predicted nucleic acid-binding protein